MIEPWRYRCPAGHVTVTHRERKGGWYCQTCNTAYRYVVDMKTDSRLFDYQKQSSSDREVTA